MQPPCGKTGTAPPAAVDDRRLVPYVHGVWLAVLRRLGMAASRLSDGIPALPGHGRWHPSQLEASDLLAREIRVRLSEQG